MSSPKSRILLVDDEPDIVQILKSSLESQGFSVSGFSEPDRALENYKRDRFDAIVLDIKMPGLNGFDLARAIWKQDPAARVCFLTAFEIYEKEARKVFKDFKTHCFLKKPMSPLALKQHIESHLLKE